MAGLDRIAVCAALESLFEADHQLYGATKMINYITDDLVKYENARIAVDKPYKMYLFAGRKDKISTRMGLNTDYSFTVTYRIEGLKSDPQTAAQNIDDIDERIDYLCDNEMWNGLNLSSHFTNSESTILNIELISSDLAVRKDTGGFKVECEGSIRLEINRIKLQSSSSQGVSSSSSAGLSSSSSVGLSSSSSSLGVSSSLGLSSSSAGLSSSSE